VQELFPRVPETSLFVEGDTFDEIEYTSQSIFLSEILQRYEGVDNIKQISGF